MVNNQWVKIALAVLAIIAMVLQLAWPGADWSVAISTAITALLGGLHATPSSAKASSQ